MNVSPKREGFVDEQQPAAPKPRPVAPPIIEPSPAETATEADAPLHLQAQWPIVIKLLYRPIRNTRGEEVKEVRMREPRAGDINRYGNPIRVNQEGDVVIDERKMTFMIAALTDILPPFIEEMDPRDWNSCAYRLRRFFLPDPAAW
jgi:hypothetical protein